MFQAPVYWQFEGIHEALSSSERQSASETSRQGLRGMPQDGRPWVHLRVCLECGHVGCCDSSKNKHATKHFHATKHPLIQSIEPGRRLDVVL